MSNKIAVTTSSFCDYDVSAKKLLRNAGFILRMNSFRRTLEDSEIIKLCGGCVGIIAGTERYTRVTLKKLSCLKVISRVGVGMENIDLDAAIDLGIKVFNSPDAPTRPVAELTMALILGLLRKIPCMNTELKNNRWKKQTGNLLYGKKVGIIGFGRIGKAVANLLIPFEVKIAYYDIQPAKLASSCAYMKKDDLLAWADIVTLHCSGSAQCKPVLGKRELLLMKKGAWLINASRGDCVDEDALCSSLMNGRLSGAALDVFRKEPYSGPLQKFDNVILTPHIGTYAWESRITMEFQAANNLLVGLDKL